MRDPKISLAVAESDYKRSPLSILEEAESGTLPVYFKFEYTTYGGRKFWRYAPIKVKALLQHIRKIGSRAAFDEQADISPFQSLGIFVPPHQPDDSFHFVVPTKIFLKENLFVPKAIFATETKGVKPKLDYTANLYPVAADIGWPGVTLTFDQTDQVQIKCKGKSSKRFRYSALGFENAKNGEASELWRLLLKFAGCHGGLECDKSGVEKFKTNIGYICKRLKSITGLKNKPIIYDKTLPGYRTIFLIQHNIKKTDDSIE